jgi:putative copper export protein
MTELAWVALRAASLVLLLQAAGAALFTAAFAHRLAHCAPAIRRTGVRAAAGALGVLAVQYLLEPVHLAGEWAGIADASLHRLVLSSSTGAALAVRAAALAGVALGLRHEGLAARSTAVAGSLAALSSFALTGHTALDEHRLLLAPLLLVHLILAAFWFGSLWPLRQVCALEPREQAARVLEAFSSGALWLVPLIPLAGLGMAAVLLPDFAALLAPYGLLLGAKLMLFAALMGLAALNKLRLTPALARGEPAALPRLRRSLAAEYVLVCAVLSVTAVLTGFFSPSQTEREAAAGRLGRAHDGAAYLGERRAVREVN